MSQQSEEIARHTERIDMAQQTPKRNALQTDNPQIGVYKDEESFQNLEKDRQLHNRQLLTEAPISTLNKELLTDAITDANEVRKEALKNARQALESAFGKKFENTFAQKLEGVQGKTQASEADINEIISELEKEVYSNQDYADDEMVQECRKRLDEAKNADPTDKDRMYRDIHRKFWAYINSLPHKSVAEALPQTDTDKAVKKFMTGGFKDIIQWISHEGSLMISALIGVAEDGCAWVQFSQLPEADRDLIRKIMEEMGVKNYPCHGFLTEFDEYKNFTVKVENSKNRGDTFTLGNRVHSVPPSEASRFGAEVKVERKGKDIIIGDRIKLERGKVQSLLGQEEQKTSPYRNGYPPRQKVSGRNAYEIRADVLEMALDWAKYSQDKKMDSEDVVAIAEAFYEFVEQK